MGLVVSALFGGSLSLDALLGDVDYEQTCFIPAIYDAFDSHLCNLFPINPIYIMLESLHILFYSSRVLLLTSSYLAEEAPHL